MVQFCESRFNRSTFCKSEPYGSWFHNQFRNDVCTISFPIYIQFFTDELEVVAPNRKMKSNRGILFMWILLSSPRSEQRFRCLVLQRHWEQQSCRWHPPFRDELWSVPGSTFRRILPVPAFPGRDREANETQIARHLRQTPDPAECTNYPTSQLRCRASVSPPLHHHPRILPRGRISVPSWTPESNESYER